MLFRSCGDVSPTPCPAHGGAGYRVARRARSRHTPCAERSDPHAHLYATRSKPRTAQRRMWGRLANAMPGTRRVPATGLPGALVVGTRRVPNEATITPTTTRRDPSPERPCHSRPGRRRSELSGGRTWPPILDIPSPNGYSPPWARILPMTGGSKSCPCWAAHSLSWRFEPLTSQPHRRGLPA